MPRNPAETAADKFAEKHSLMSKRLSAAVRKRIADGESVDDAIKAATADLKYEQFLSKAITDSALSLVATGTGSPMSRKWWLNHVWRGDDMSLSARIADAAKMGDIRESILVAMKDGKAWNSMATKLQTSKLVKGDVAGYMRDLENAGRRLIGGDASALKEYKKALSIAEANIEKLAQNGAPTARLKKAYESVIKATEKRSEKALDKAIDRAVRAKSQANAERIARTETAKAYSQQTYVEALGDKQVIGIGYDLNSGHPRTDICDFHTGADLFGLGKGRYPLSKLPPYPFHPQCLCSSYNVYSGDSKPMDKGAAKKFINGLSEKEKKALLGVSGAKDFRKSKDSWQDNLKNYQGHKSINALMEIKK